MSKGCPSVFFRSSTDVVRVGDCRENAGLWDLVLRTESRSTQRADEGSLVAVGGSEAEEALTLNFPMRVTSRDVTDGSGSGLKPRQAAKRSMLATSENVLRPDASESPGNGWVAVAWSGCFCVLVRETVLVVVAIASVPL
mmetsp:Transcript_14429/g.39091  ORF Transcript_14429/g.39091 Transcript_14429/m.39091 type:complete len:140 (-) Transcript_14429:784-1203(-)